MDTTIGMARRTDNTASIIFTPPEVAQLSLQEVKNRAGADPASDVPFFVPGMDSSCGVHNARPGDLISLIGRPSNYKSGLAQYIAKKNAERIVRNKYNDKCVVYVTYEQAVEEMGMYEIAAHTGVSVSSIISGNNAVDIVAMEQAAANRAALPLYLMGHSSSRRAKRPTMTLDIVEDALWELMSGNITERKMFPTLVVIDYLQRIKDGAGSDIRIRTIENIDKAKDMALGLGCVVLLLSQAKREVDFRENKMPSMADGQESANIEQAADKVICTMMPQVYEPFGKTIKAGKLDVTVQNGLLVISMPKQKNGPAGMTWQVHVDPGLNKISELETVNLSEYTASDFYSYKMREEAKREAKQVALWQQ